MAFTHSWKSKELHVKFINKFTSQDLILSNSKMVGNTEFGNIKFLIVDFSDVTELAVDDVDVSISAKFAIDTDHYNKNLRVASICDNEALATLIEQFIEKVIFEVPNAQHKLFSNISEAKNWLTS